MKRKYLTPTFMLVPIALNQCVAVSTKATSEQYEELTFDWE